MDLLIYLEKTNSRVEYIFNHIFHHILGLDIQYTTDVNLFLDSAIPKIQYSNKPVSNALFFQSANLLFEQNVRQQDVKMSIYKNTKIFFLSSDMSSCLPFDPFAASFYMLTRYEEYVFDLKDDIGRFPANKSLAHTNGFLNMPVVDYWILDIKKILQKRFSNLRFKKQTFNFINTIDVDNAFAYLEKSYFRIFGSFLKDLIKLDFQKIKNKTQVFLGKKKDPYDTYDDLLKIHKHYKLKTIFFFLLGDYSKYDRNIPFSNKRLQKKIRQIFNYCHVGIHSSYSSIKSPNNLTQEIDRLKFILDQSITINRQHFLNLNIPKNYQNLIKNNIKHDYSMGFPSLPGFRAGTSNNFYFFDLTKNVSTTLLIHPFVIMDVTLKNYMQLNPNDAFSIIKSLIDQVKHVNGTFISIWHNESLDYLNTWQSWDNVYENMVKYTFR